MIPLALYLHLPWCEKKCPYCDFNSHQTPANLNQSQYINALISDIEPQTRIIDTIFIGGGTPSLFSGVVIMELFTALNEKLILAANAEITIEANPNSLTLANLLQYQQAGINRISIGAQSFNNQLLKLIGRVHNSEQISTSFNMARLAKFTNINLDLMFGLPEQTQAMALADLQTAINLSPEHISWYQLTIEPNTQFFSCPPKKIPEHNLLFDMQQAGIELLAQNGFKRYEISAFSRDLPCQHNLNYWQFGDYLGIGAGGHGKQTTNNEIIRTTKYRSPDKYLTAINKTSSTRKLKINEVGFEFMLNALRLVDGFELSLFKQRTGLELAHLIPKINSAVNKNYLTKTNSWLKPTTAGINFYNDLLEIFLP